MKATSPCRSLSAGRFDGQDRFVEILSKRLGVKSMEDWYAVRVGEIRKRGGSTLLDRHGGSVHRLVRFLYPNHAWNLWKFRPLPEECFRRLESVAGMREMLEYLAGEVRVKSL